MRHTRKMKVSVTFAILIVLFLARSGDLKEQEPCKGDDCKCELGFWGHPCKKCECGDKATTCDYTSGKCHCSTKGMIGDKCDMCDEKNRYKGDAVKDNCFYDVDESIKYYFKFVKPSHANITKLNLKFAPENKNEDMVFKVTCIEHCNEFTIKMIAKEKGTDKIIIENDKVKKNSTLEKLLSHKDYKFGTEKEKKMSEIVANIHDFKTPIVLEVILIPETKLKEKILITLNES